jgi:uncharacterized membrane protein affecting hemolysin expression
MKLKLSAPTTTRLSDRLRRINQVTLGIALAFVAFIVIASSFAINLHSMVGDSRAKAMVLADNASATLMFHYEREAQELLKSLKHSPDVNAAAIYDQNRHLFAHYLDKTHDVLRETLPTSLNSLREAVFYKLNHISVIQPIVHENELLGGLLLLVDLKPLYEQIAGQAMITFFAALVAMVLARFLLIRVSRSVQQPLSYSRATK